MQDSIEVHDLLLLIEVPMSATHARAPSWTTELSFQCLRPSASLRAAGNNIIILLVNQFIFTRVGTYVQHGYKLLISQNTALLPCFIDVYENRQ
jgi:hypothetical protein